MKFGLFLALPVLAGLLLLTGKLYQRHIRSELTREAVASAQRAIAKKDFGAAQTTLVNALEKNPELTGVRAMLARVAVRTSPDEALKHARTALRDQSADRIALDVVTAVYTHRKMRAVSRADLTRVLEAEISEYEALDPAGNDNPVALYRLASVRLQLVSQSPLRAAEVDIARKEIAQLLRSAESKDSKKLKASALALSARCDLLQGEMRRRDRKTEESRAAFTAAIGNLQKALDLEPDRTGAVADLAVAYGAIGKTEELAAELQRRAAAASAGPAKAAIMSVHAGVLAGMGRDDEGLVECREAIRIAPTQPAGYVCASLVLQKKSDGSGAEMALQDAVKQIPHFVGGWIALAHRYDQGGNTAAAIDALERALAVDPRLAVWQTILTPGPASANELYYRTAIRLAELNLQAGNDTAALAAAARAQMHGGPAPEVRQIVARVELRRRNYRAAIAAVEPVVRNTGRSDARFVLAQAYVGMGRNDAARSQVTLALGDKGFADRREAEALLARLN